MDDATISAVVSEFAPLIVGRSPGKIFQLDRESFAIDFGLRSHGFLFISVAPASPRLYLIKRRQRDLEKQSQILRTFALALRKELSATQVRAITKLPSDRIVQIDFQGANEIGEQNSRSLIAQLTGRSANLLLVDGNDVVVAHAREGVGAGQTIGETYQPPPNPRLTANAESHFKSLDFKDGKSISEQLDAFYTTLFAEKSAQAELENARARLRNEISRRKKLLQQLDNDLMSHTDAEQQKRIGDLLLANATTATRDGESATLIDYFTDDARKIEIQIDEKLTLPEEATRRFDMYARSKRARKQIASRVEKIKTEIADFEMQRDQLEAAPEITLLPPPSSLTRTKPRKEKVERIPGVRRYRSTDGYEILVGRTARDNDHLTFKIAKPNDIWLHAVDYPGSHVVVRNPTRKEIPHRTLVEAAQLAAHFSQANKDPKVDVHYTPRKFLLKPKGAAPGLVRMSRFKSLVVGPVEAGQRQI